MTIALPHPSILLPPQPDGTTPVNPQAIQDNLDALALSGDAFGGVSAQIRFGTATVTFSGASLSAATTINHGLGRTPVNIQLTSHSAGIDFNINGTAPTSTTFLVNGSDSAGAARTGTFSFDWLAIG